MSIFDDAIASPNLDFTTFADVFLVDCIKLLNSLELRVIMSKIFATLSCTSTSSTDKFFARIPCVSLLESYEPLRNLSTLLPAVVP